MCEMETNFTFWCFHTCQQGLDEFRKALLEAALDPSSFPHSNSSTIQPSTVALYDQILALREHDVVLLPWQQFQEEVVEEGSGVSLESLEDDVAYLADVVRVNLSHWVKRCTLSHGKFRIT